VLGLDPLLRLYTLDTITDKPALIQTGRNNGKSHGGKIIMMLSEIQ
jgi:hypothetical protein